MPEKSLKTIEELLLYIKKRLSYTGNLDRRLNNSDTPGDITDANIDNRITKFVDAVNNEKVYRIPLRYFCNLGKINYPVKINLKITCLLETDIFELKKKSAVVGTPDAKIIFTNAPHIQCKQFKLNNNCRQYIKTIVSSSKVLRMGIEKALLQKTFGMSEESQSFNIDFLGANRQFYWLEISLTFDKSGKNTTQNMTVTILKKQQHLLNRLF